MTNKAHNEHAWTEHITTDVAIVGAGPIGIELAAAFKHQDVAYEVFEAGQIGATIQWWAPETRFFSGPERIAIAGVPLVTPDQGKATREQYLSYLRSVVLQHQLDIRAYERVVDIKPIIKPINGATPQSEHRFTLSTVRSSHGVGGEPELDYQARGQTHGSSSALLRTSCRAKHVVLAIGDMHLPHMLSIPGETLPHVSHYLDDPHMYFGSRVLIVGGKNSAVEAAIRLWRSGAKVSVSYRGAELEQKRIKYWLYPEMKWLIDKHEIGWHPGTVPVRIDERVVTLAGAQAHPNEHAKESQKEEPKEEQVQADFVLLLTGYKQDPQLLRIAGISLEGDGKKPTHTHTSMETNVPGIYVAGTATAGTQLHGVKAFIETSHVHVERIVSHITGDATTGNPALRDVRDFDSLPES